METLSNGIISIGVKEHGAELCSIVVDGKEYLWQADPAFWKRHSPVLFPVVGKAAGFSQHGFARDMDFTLISKTEDTIWFALEQNEDSLKLYPYDFRLEIGYRIEGKSVDVMWRVINPSDKDMAFQIGAHPAFYWPDADFNPSDLGWFRLDTGKASLKRSVIGEGGLVDPKLEEIQEIGDGGYLALDASMFDRDALIFEDDQVHAVTLCARDKRAYVTLSFDAPLVGLWTPPGKNAPFVCIEPWYGRTDTLGYDGPYENRKWTNWLKGGEAFNASYKITIE